MKALLILLIGAAAYLLLFKKGTGESVSPTIIPVGEGGMEPPLPVSPLPPVAPPPPREPEEFVMTPEQRMASTTGLAINRVRQLIHEGYSEGEIAQIGYNERVPGSADVGDIESMRTKERVYWPLRFGQGRRGQE